MKPPFLFGSSLYLSLPIFGSTNLITKAVFAFLNTNRLNLPFIVHPISPIGSALKTIFHFARLLVQSLGFDPRSKMPFSLIT